MTENNKNLGIDGFDPSKVNKLSAKEILKRVGPGIVLTGVVIGPGNITTSAMIGANYGYSLVWLIIPILIMGVLEERSSGWIEGTKSTAGSYDSQLSLYISNDSLCTCKLYSEADCFIFIKIRKYVSASTVL
ncbi:hypothetical protein [[Ruminococcus] torques]|uniref:Manganese transport protein MntH n=1 Tax=[Ruminococcus] torques TaxID=33039 RepID=A0A175AB08_9FIRM|nr:hypothetical protein [[Ruminococcus] torques]CUQ93306.1 manganese transport protein MntH [[Ruminococcus] torques]